MRRKSAHSRNAASATTPPTSADSESDGAGDRQDTPLSHGATTAADTTTRCGARRSSAMACNQTRCRARISSTMRTKRVSIGRFGRSASSRDRGPDVRAGRRTQRDPLHRPAENARAATSRAAGRARACRAGSASACARCPRWDRLQSRVRLGVLFGLESRERTVQRCGLRAPCLDTSTSAARFVMKKTAPRFVSGHRVRAQLEMPFPTVRNQPHRRTKCVIPGARQSVS